MNEADALQINQITEVRAVFGPRDSMRATIVTVAGTRERTYEVLARTREPMRASLAAEREQLDATTFSDPSTYQRTVAGRLAGLLTMSVDVTDQRGEWLRMTERDRDIEPLTYEEILPGHDRDAAMATLLQDRDFLHTRVRRAEDGITELLGRLEAANHRRHADVEAVRQQLDEVRAERDVWRRKARKRKRTLVEARRLLAGVGALPPYPHKIKGGDES